ncbi:AAA family ATPase [Tistrella bauzanensis]|uniref:AAA family ATPase n=1 Tax=Tistrella arctica TaxID=3133430 RepID=A0ABU9YHE6_9PROT
MAGYVIISGCSGGGKSTLLAELGRRGFATVPEPGRRIVAEQRRQTGHTQTAQAQTAQAQTAQALPWIDMAAFARRAIAMALDDRAAVARAAESGATAGWIFFDRGLIDAAVALQHATGEPAIETLGRAHRYHPHVFLTPPWPAIYHHDDARAHDLAAAIAEYHRLRAAYATLGYTATILPLVSVQDRADLVLARLVGDVKVGDLAPPPL